MQSRRNPTKTKIKSLVVVLGLAGGSFGLFRYMSGFPEPGRVGQPLPTDYENVHREVAERVERDVLWLCEDIGRRSSRFSVRAVQLRETLEQSILDAGFKLESHTYKAGTNTFYNTVGVREGRGRGTILIGTHYDSYSKSLCANATATGVATVMETLRALRNEPTEPTVIVAFFGTGEAPHTGRETMGAQRWLDDQLKEGRQIDAAYLVGSFGCFRPGEGGQNSAFPWYLSHPASSDWVGVYGAFLGRSFVTETLAAWAEATDLPARGFATPGWMLGVPAYDQIPFQKAGIPAVLFSDTGENRDASLRTQFDIPYVIDFKEMARRVEGFTGMIKNITKSSVGASVVAAG
ncbi:Peptidase family M28 [Planctomycetes bacterium Poly30]|uniref:Peptidase family M28 n=1 Tax=Saltatorellus ferox TaxID=2528018 RepID=A0A518EWM5_9BACT|nr:Peptidase family M28 [Planctomycetes bacterium Poly30]